MKTKTVFLPLSVALALAAHGAEWNVVASFDATKTGDLSKAGGAAEYVYRPEEIPPDVMPVNSAERKIVFGEQMVFAWSGTSPGAQYKIRAAFLSDRDNRSLQVELNGRPLEKDLSLSKWKMLEREWAVPAGTITNGDITITVSRLSGPNAVLSRLEILSDSPQTLYTPSSPEEILDKMQVPMPRLSPRPVKVDGVKTPLVSLDGTWKFNPKPPSGFEQFSAAETEHWAKIEVPGEWVMQGFAVKSNSAAAYWREFEIPADWFGRRIKLRFDTVHSDCRVFVNGQEVGAHEGCFTAFELDITGAVKPGRNTIALAVKNESIADSLASASQYAAHQLGGITRKVQLFALPEVNVAMQIVTTAFDKDFKDAKLNIHLDVANESSNSSVDGGTAAKFTLVDSDGKIISTETVNLPAVLAGQTCGADIAIPVAVPKKWDSEHPNLYLLKSELLMNNRVVQQISQRVGFRQIEIRGNQLFINGVPVKLRGVCRHEVDPVRGRSLTLEDWKKDAELFRAANVNYIRTSHYPPAEEFLNLCDEYGMFVECEAPLCWVQSAQSPDRFPYLMRANLENLAANRNHPSIIIWSLANESDWSPLFAEVNRRVKMADPTRPTCFDGGNGQEKADIASRHYPGPDGPAKCDRENRPVLFGEYCHVECYNRRELATDPGVRDEWGRGLAPMSDLMYQHESCLGGAIWAGIDDVFCLPDGKFVGYGMWGSICDGWRREKPEFWHVKMTYSPVRMTTNELPLPAPEESIRVPVENRYNFANLSEVGIAWDIGSDSGTAHADIPARHTGEIVIQPHSLLENGDVLHLVFTDPRGFVCDEEKIILGKPAEPAVAAAEKLDDKLSVSEDDGKIQVSGRDVKYVIDRKTGHFITATIRGKTVLVGGPSLMILPLQTEACEPVDLGVWKPLNNVCENWQAESVNANETTNGAVEMTVNGSCREADGGYVIRLENSGEVQIRYNFTSRVQENQRQWGMVFFAPQNFNMINWNRQAQWTVYPADHVGRPVGTATAGVALGGKPYPTRRPDHAWSLDATELGGNDFSSTKRAILKASLTSPTGEISVVSDGHQSVRAFVEDGRTGLLVAGFDTGGGDGFFARHFDSERRPLRVGTDISDTISLQLYAGESQHD